MGHFDTCLSPLTFNMKSFALVLALVAVAVAKPDFEACPGFEDNTFVNPWKLTINPDPIVAKEGESVEIHFDATVLKTLPVGTKVEFKMVKSGIPLPCLPIPGLPIHIGSCSYDAEDLLALITPEDCKKFAPRGTCLQPSPQPRLLWRQGPQRLQGLRPAQHPLHRQALPQRRHQGHRQGHQRRRHRVPLHAKHCHCCHPLNLKFRSNWNVFNSRSRIENKSR